MKDVNSTSANTSAVLPQLATLLKNQEDVQILTNLLLQNSIVTIKEFLQEKLEWQDHIITSQQKNHNQTANLLQGHQNSLDQMVISLAEIANSNIQMANTQTQMVNAQIQMSHTLAQIAATQTQIASSFNQVVNLLEKQDRQLANMTATMNYVVPILENQQETLTDINHSLPLVSDQLERKFELLKLSLSTSDTTTLGQQ